MGAQNNFATKFPKLRNFQPEILYFCQKIFTQENFLKAKI